MPRFEDPSTGHVQDYLDIRPGGSDRRYVTDAKGNQIRPCYKYLFVHGGCFSGGNPGFAKEIAQNLSDRYEERVVVPNHRTDSLEHATHDIMALAVELFGENPDNLVICGGSSGGYLAQAVAERSVVKFAKMMLFCPVADPPARMNYLCTCAEPLFTGEPPKPGHKDPKRAAKMIKDQQKFDFNVDVYWEPAIETLVIAGGRDENVPLSTLNKLLSAATVTAFVKGSGTHDLQRRISEETFAHIDAFLGDS